MLRLPTDGPATGPLLDDVLAREGAAAIVAAIARALPPLAARLAAGRLHGDPEAIVGTNDSGDRQKALDVAARRRLSIIGPGGRGGYFFRRLSSRFSAARLPQRHFQPPSVRA